MQTNAIPTSAPGDAGDRAPTSEKPALIKMTKQQQTKLDQAMPVRTEASAHSLLEPCAARSTARCPHSRVTSARAPVSLAKRRCTLHLLTRCKPVICAANEPPSPRTSLTCAARLTRAMHAEPALCHLPSTGPTCSARPCAAWSCRLPMHVHPKRLPKLSTTKVGTRHSPQHGCPMSPAFTHRTQTITI